MKPLQLLTVLAAIFIFSSCKKGLGDDNANPFENATPIVTEKGTPLGSATSYPVNASATTIASADGKLDLIIPAGAFSSATTVSIQPISNLAPLGLSTGYRLLPEGVTFSKPVTLRFHYTNADLGTTIEDFLWINTQNNDGTWMGNKNSVVDKATKTITVETTHFSDWTIGRFMDLTLSPARATVKVNDKLNLSITGFLETDENRDDLLVPLSPVKFGPNTPVTEEQQILLATQQFLSFNIKEWMVNGSTSGGRFGSIEPGNLHAVYKAPGTVPNPAKVSLSVNMVARKRNLPNTNYVLVSEVTIIGSPYYLRLKVDGGEYFYTEYGVGGVLPTDNNNFQMVNCGITDEGFLQIAAGYYANSNLTNSFTINIKKTSSGSYSLNCFNNTSGQADEMVFMPASNGIGYQNNYVVRSRNTQNNCTSTYKCAAINTSFTKFGTGSMTEVEGSFSGTLYYNGLDFDNQCKSSEAHNVSGDFLLMRLN